MIATRAANKKIALILAPAKAILKHSRVCSLVCPVLDGNPSDSDSDRTVGLRLPPWTCRRRSSPRTRQRLRRREENNGGRKGLETKLHILKGKTGWCVIQFTILARTREPEFSLGFCRYTKNGAMHG